MTTDAQSKAVMDLQEIDIKDFISEKQYVPKTVKISQEDGSIDEKRVEIKKLTKGEEDQVLAEFNDRQIEANADGQMSGFSMSLSQIEGMRKQLVSIAMDKYSIDEEGVNKMSSELYSQILRLALEVNPIDMLQLPEKDEAGKKAGTAAEKPKSTEEALKNE